jgi:hypothetical protein
MKSKNVFTLSIVALSLGAFIQNSEAALIYSIAGNSTITYDQPGVSPSISPGTYDVDGTLVIEIQSITATTATFQTNLYSISLDKDMNGAFYESSDAIIESSPYTNIRIHVPTFMVHPHFWDVPDDEPATLTTNSNGTWELRGLIGSYLAPWDYGADTDTNGIIASGTFIGTYNSPESFTLNSGYLGGNSLGPSFPYELGTPSITFNAIPEPSGACLLITGGFLYFVLTRKRLRIT